MMIVEPVGRDSGVVAAVATVSPTGHLVLRRWGELAALGALPFLLAVAAAGQLAWWVLRPVRDLDRATVALSVEVAGADAFQAGRVGPVADRGERDVPVRRPDRDRPSGRDRSSVGEQQRQQGTGHAGSVVPAPVGSLSATTVRRRSVVRDRSRGVATGSVPGPDLRSCRRRRTEQRPHPLEKVRLLSAVGWRRANDGRFARVGGSTRLG